MGKDIYISYRKRDEGGFVAGMLREFLVDQGYSVAEAINKQPVVIGENVVKAIESCTDFLVIFSEYTFDCMIENGTDDYIAQELLVAHKSGKNIIPIILPDVDLSKTKDLPESLQALNLAPISYKVETQKEVFERIKKLLVSKSSVKNNGVAQSSVINKPYEGDEGYIFISYAHKDSGIVLKVINELQKNNYRVWYDEGIDPGTEWDENIAKHVENCGYFIAFMSKNYIASSNCKDELNFARDLEKKRFLVYIEEVELPSAMKMRLTRTQNIHMYKYERIEDFYDKLFRADGLDAFESGVMEGKKVTSHVAPTEAVEGEDARTKAPSTSTTSRKPRGRIVHRDIVDVDFHDWLLNRNHTPSVADDYIYALYRAEKKGIAYGLTPFELIVVDSVKVRSAIDALFKVEEFVELNKKNHNKYKAALERWYEFIVELEQRKVAAPAAVNMQTSTVNEDFVIENGVLKKYKGTSKDVVIPESVSVIDSYCFMDKEIESVVIPGSVSSIEEGAFDGCENLKSVTIGDGVMSIGWFAFNNCVSLTSIIIPNTVINMGENVFKNCTSLTTVTFSRNLTYIPEEVFFNCKSLTSITIPSKVASIGRKAFAHCESLASIIIPKCVIIIGDEAFLDCINLTNVDISKGLLLQSKSAFDEALYEKLVVKNAPAN